MAPSMKVMSAAQRSHFRPKRSEVTPAPRPPTKAIAVVMEVMSSLSPLVSSCPKSVPTLTRIPAKDRKEYAKGMSWIRFLQPVENHPTHR